MASIERTAYPRYQRSLTPAELRLHYTLTDDERAWLQATTRGSARMLCCAVLLKAVQHLGYFPGLFHVLTSRPISVKTRATAAP